MPDENEKNQTPEVSPAEYSDSEAGNTPPATQPGSAQGDTNPENGNAEQQAETSSEDRGEEPGENLEVPAEGTSAEGTESESSTLSNEDGAAETDVAGADEGEGSETASEDGRPKATDEEKDEYRSLQHKRSQTNLSPEDFERLDYLGGLNHDQDFCGALANIPTFLQGDRNGYWLGS